jgi:hypothetical protein
MSLPECEACRDCFCNGAGRIAFAVRAVDAERREFAGEDGTAAMS